MDKTQTKQPAATRSRGIVIKAERVQDGPRPGEFVIILPVIELSEQAHDILNALFPNLREQVEMLLNKETLLQSIISER